MMLKCCLKAILLLKCCLFSAYHCLYFFYGTLRYSIVMGMVAFLTDSSGRPSTSTATSFTKPWPRSGCDELPLLGRGDARRGERLIIPWIIMENHNRSHLTVREIYLTD